MASFPANVLLGLYVVASRTCDNHDVPVRQQRACMLAYTFYETDGRVRRYAEALVAEGWDVDAIVLKRRGQPEYECVKGVHVIRIQEREKNERSKWDYAQRLLRFLITSARTVTGESKARPYDLIHVHSVPDFEVLAAMGARRQGAKVILDIHDIVPEFYAAKFGVKHSSWIFHILRLLEKASASLADHVIIANDLWYERITNRSVRAEKCSTFINYPDTDVFRPISEPKDESRFVFCYPGSLNKHQGIDLAVRAVSEARVECQDIRLEIYGEGEARQSLVDLVADLGVENWVSINAPRPRSEIARIMARSDMGLVPKRNEGFGGEAFSTKILEFMSVGVPVLASRTRIDQYYFDDSLLWFFQPDDVRSLVHAMISARHGLERRSILISNGLKFAQDNSWTRRKKGYVDLVSRLTQPQNGADYA